MLFNYISMMLLSLELSLKLFYIVFYSIRVKDVPLLQLAYVPSYNLVFTSL